MTAVPASGPHAAPEPRRRRQGRPSTLDRDAALVAARDVIAARGFDRARYADVAARAGVPVTTLQHAFGSLQAMLLESVQRSTADEIPGLRDRSHGDLGSPWERLQAFVAGAVHDPDDPQSWLVWLELWRLAARDAEIGARAGSVYAQWWDYVAELITLGAESGEFRGPLVRTPFAAAQSVVAVIDGLAAALVMRADGADHARVERLALGSIAAMLGYDDRRPSPAEGAAADRSADQEQGAGAGADGSFAIAVEQGASDASIDVDGPVPAAEPLSAEGPLPDLPVGHPAREPA